MEIVTLDPGNRRQVKQFLRLPFTLYRENKQWVPPLAMETRGWFDRKNNPFYEDCEAAFLLAVEDGQALGRLVVIDNPRYNKHNQKSSALFYLFESVEDQRVSQGLFDAAFAWAKGRGLTQILGPKGFSPGDGIGLLVEGFEHRPAFGIPYNHAYYGDMLEAAGFLKEEDLLSGYLSTNMEVPEGLDEMSRQLQEKLGLHVARYTRRKDLRPLVPKLKDLYNRSLADADYGYPITARETEDMADQMLWFADPKLIKIIMHGEEPVGFLFAYPDVSAALQRTGGRLFPFGWWPILRERRRTEWVIISAMGIVKEFRRQGATAILFSEMLKSVQSQNFRHADLTQAGESNKASLASGHAFGIDFYKRHRLYQRSL